MIASRPASATARLVAAQRERQDRGRDDRRERGVGPEHEDARRTEHRVREQRDDRRVQARLGGAAPRRPRSPFRPGSAARSPRCRRARRATATPARTCAPRRRPAASGRFPWGSSQLLSTSWRVRRRSAIEVSAPQRVEDLVDHECRPDEPLQDGPDVLPEPLGLLPEIHPCAEDAETVERTAAGEAPGVRAPVAHICHPCRQQYARGRGRTTGRDRCRDSQAAAIVAARSGAAAGCW